MSDEWNKRRSARLAFWLHIEYELRNAAWLFLVTKSWTKEEIVVQKALQPRKFHRMICDLIAQHIGDLQVRELAEWSQANIFQRAVPITLPPSQIQITFGEGEV